MISEDILPAMNLTLCIDFARSEALDISLVVDSAK
jgi:hypothetical protein